MISTSEPCAVTSRSTRLCYAGNCSGVAAHGLNPRANGGESGRVGPFGADAGLLRQVAGAAGLWSKAGLTKFDPTRGALPATYASWWAYARAHEESYANASIIRVSNNAREGGRGNPSVRIAGKQAMAPMIRLDRQEDSGHEKLDEKIADEQAVMADTHIEEEEQMASRLDGMAKAMADLPKREVDILRRHIGDGESLAAIGAELGISRERARQLEERVVGRIRVAMDVPADAPGYGRKREVAEPAPIEPESIDEPEFDSVGDEFAAARARRLARPKTRFR